jgi:hypothetical protein
LVEYYYIIKEGDKKIILTSWITEKYINEDGILRRFFVLNRKLNEKLEACRFNDIEMYFHIYSK